MNFTAIFAELRRWLESRFVAHKNLTITLKFGSKEAAFDFREALGNEFNYYRFLGKGVLRMQIDGLEVHVEGPSDA